MQCFEVNLLALASKTISEEWNLLTVIKWSSLQKEWDVLHTFFIRLTPREIQLKLFEGDLQSGKRDRFLRNRNNLSTTKMV